MSSTLYPSLRRARDFEDSAEKPHIRFVVKPCERKYQWPVKVVSLWAVLLPAFPISPVFGEDVERFLMLIPFSEVDFIGIQIIERENVMKLDRHPCRSTFRRHVELANVHP